MLTHIVCHIFRMAWPANFKLGIRMEDVDLPQVTKTQILTQTLVTLGFEQTDWDTANAVLETETCFVFSIWRPVTQLFEDQSLSCLKTFAVEFGNFCCISFKYWTAVRGVIFMGHDVWMSFDVEIDRWVWHTKYQSNKVSYLSRHHTTVVLLYGELQCRSTASLAIVKYQRWICIVLRREYASDALQLPVRRHWSRLASLYSQTSAPHCETTDTG